MCAEEKAAVRHATKQWMARQARQLWEEGILTKDQYEQERARIMNRCVPAASGTGAPNASAEVPAEVQKALEEV